MNLEDTESKDDLSKPHTRGFRPKLVTPEKELSSEEVSGPQISEHQALILKSLSETIDLVLAGEIVGMVMITINASGDQEEFAISDESDYAILGRMSVANATLADTLMYLKNPEE